MSRYHRREFLADVGRGMLVASVGSALAQDLGLAPAALADGGDRRLTFGPMEPLVALMQETPADRLLPAVVERMKGGTDLRQLVAAAALANARTFGGQDYDGYHALMALVPAYQMSCELPEAQRALPVLKVLYRNTNHIQQMGGHVARGAASGRAGRLARGPASAARPCARRPARRGHGGGRAALRRAGARVARRGLQRPPVRRPGLCRRPPRRPGLARLGPARPDRQGARPHLAAPVGAVLRGRRSATFKKQPDRGGAAGPACPACSSGRAWRAGSPGIASRTTPGSSG